MEVIIACAVMLIALELREHRNQRRHEEQSSRIDWIDDALSKEFHGLKFEVGELSKELKKLQLAIGHEHEQIKSIVADHMKKTSEIAQDISDLKNQYELKLRKEESEPFDGVAGL